MPKAIARFYDAILTALGLPPGIIEPIFNFYIQLSLLCYLCHWRSSSPSTRIFSRHDAAFHLYTTILKRVARKGYVVAAIDHPYDAEFVEFPDGKNVREPKRPPVMI